MQGQLAAWAVTLSEVSVCASCHPGKIRGVMSEQWLNERGEMRGQ